jgi:hypothetical protein
MTAGELQAAIWKVEGIRIVVFTDAVTQLPLRQYCDEAFPEDKTVAEFKQERLQALLDAGIGFVVLDGMLEAPSSRTTLKTLRGSYTIRGAVG